MASLVFLGKPHHGVGFEKTSNWIDLILGAHACTDPFARLVKVLSAQCSVPSAQCSVLGSLMRAMVMCWNRITAY